MYLLPIELKNSIVRVPEEAVKWVKRIREMLFTSFGCMSGEQAGWRIIKVDVFSQIEGFLLPSISEVESWQIPKESQQQRMQANEALLALPNLSATSANRYESVGSGFFRPVMGVSDLTIRVFEALENNGHVGPSLIRVHNRSLLVTQRGMLVLDSWLTEGESGVLNTLNTLDRNTIRTVLR